MNKKPFWEESYRKEGLSDTFASGEPSAEFYDLIKDMSPRATALDLGCGDGRNAIFLAENGCNVTVIDISDAGIKKLQQYAVAKGLSIATEVQDIRDYILNDSYDLIIAHGSLHFIERKYWVPLIDKIKSHTNIGGYNVIAVFTDTLPSPDDLKDFTIGLFHEGELFTFYNDWRIILQQSYILEDEHPGNIIQKHPINKIVAQNKN